MLNKKQLIGISVIMAVLIVAFAFYSYREKMGEAAGEDKGDYIPCVSLNGNETVDIELPKYVYATRSAEKCARDLMNEGRCQEAWVNGRGNCVTRLNQSQVKYEYNRVLREIKLKKQAYDEEGLITFDISYDCSNITYYINDNTEYINFWGATWSLPTYCKTLQLYAGIPLEDVEVNIKIIYLPTGKTVDEWKSGERVGDNAIDEEKWNSLVEEAKKE